jgi:hypothetical protein
MEPSAAAKILDDLEPTEKQTLVRSVLNEHAKNGGPSPTPVLQALRYLPGAEGKGHSTQNYVGAGKGIGSALISDASDAIRGLPAGLGLAGISAAEDIKDLPGDIIHARPVGKNLYNKVLTPIGKGVAHEYGPLASGNFGEFGHRFAQHPLGPILDVAALASGGLGGAARTSDALAAIRSGAVEDIAQGAARGGVKVGDQFTVQQQKNGMWLVRDGNKWISSNLPDKASAIKHAQSLSTNEAMGKSFGISGSTLERGVKGFVKGGGSRGQFLGRYEERFKPDDIHNAETERLVKDLQSTMDDPNLRLDRRSFKEVVSDVRGDLAATRAKGKARAGEMLKSPEESPFVKSPVYAKGRVAAATTLREATALVKAGAIYLRPAYLPNNWAGNAFMNAAHQGVLAPANLAKSFVLDKHLGPRYLKVIDKGMGENAASILRDPRAGGYVQSITDPIVRSMGAAADMPFRRAAWLHEARRAGYSKLSDVRELMDRAASGTDQGAYREMADISRKAQEEIVKFGQMSDTERKIIQHIVFVYSWIRGATRYAARFPLQHPIQSAVYQHLAKDVGNPYVTKNLGGVPSFMHGVVPVGRDKNGNPILINPFALNPLGTAVQAGQALGGTLNIMRGGKFDKYTDQDIGSLLTPIPAAYLTAREGGKPMTEQLQQTFAPARLVHDLRHPGSGSIFPTSRTEALGHYIAGSLYPRTADQAALERTLERQQRGDPVARLNLDAKQYKKLTGQALPQDFINAYKQDILKWTDMKKFQQSYASDHGHSGFRNLPPANRVDAAISYLNKLGVMDDQQAKDMRSSAARMTNDQDLNRLASSLWGGTGIGQVKLSWDQMMRDARGLRLSRARQ